MEEGNMQCDMYMCVLTSNVGCILKCCLMCYKIMTL